MKLGCLGCLGALALACLLLAGGVGAALWAWTALHAVPPLLPPTTGASDSSSAERRMAELWQRDPGTSRRAERLVLGEPEVAALLKRHLDGAGLPLSVIHVRLRQSEIAVQGRLALGALLEGEAVSPLGSLIPRRSLDAPVWITLWGTISLGPSANPRRASHAEATLTASQIGRLPMPACALTVLAGPRGAALLRWPVPLAVTGLEVGDGKLTIRAR